MRFLPWLLLLGCSGTPEDDDAAPVDEADADTDADADADADTDTDTDTDTDPGPRPDTSVRVVHVAPGLPAQDMVVNGTLPPVLEDLGFEEGTGYSKRPADTFTFQFKDEGADLATAWISFDYELLLDRRHSLVVYGTPDAPDVLRLRDDDLSLASYLVRIRWTHIATHLAPTLDIWDLASATLLVDDLAYGATVELDHDPATVQIGLDEDDDGVPEVVFEDFQRSAGEYFHVMLVNEADGAPFLLGHAENGQTHRRDVVPYP